MRLAIALLAIASYPAAAQPISINGSHIGRGLQQQPIGKGAISGSVVNEVTHEPMKKARVLLNGPVGLNAVTDDAGHFAFKLLPPGPYNLQVLDDHLSAQRPRIATASRSNVTLAADEQKSGVALSLVPGTAISGRLADEEGMPLPNCNVSALQFNFNQGKKTLGSRNTSNTNEKGEYRIADLASGNYLIFARCHQTIPLPHAFIRRNSGIETPTLSYTPQFYPGTPDVHAASKLAAAGGTELSGIDFRLSPGGGVTLRGKIGSTDPEAANGNIQVMLEPRDPFQRGIGMIGARYNRQSGEFRVDHVGPGSYNVVANTFFSEGKRYYANIPIEIGSSQPEPLQLMLAPALTLTGVLTQEGESNVPLQSAMVHLNSTERFHPGIQPNTTIQKDGTFTLNGIVPGRWLLMIGGAPGYIKSISLNNRESTSQVFEIPEGAAGPIKVVLSTAMAQIEGTVSGLPSEPAQLSGILWRMQEGLVTPGQPLTINPQGKFSTSHLQPGKYVVCAVGAEPWILLQNPATMDALKSRCETVDLSTAASTSVQLRFIPNKDLETLLASLDN